MKQKIYHFIPFNCHNNVPFNKSLNHIHNNNNNIDDNFHNDRSMKNNTNNDNKNDTEK